jgi:hypothetical protein
MRPKTYNDLLEAMDEKLVQLLSMLPGLEAAKNAIQAQINDIHRSIHQIRGTVPRGDQIADPEQDLRARDTLGRLIQRRTLSPELREKKRLLIATAREQRLKRLREAQGKEPVDTD